MRKAILILILTVVSSSAAAEWVKVTGDESSTLYSDPSTIRKKGNMVKMWSLINNKTALAISSGNYLSEKTQEEFDCKEELVRNLYHSFHSGNMGGGDEILPMSTGFNWSPVPPGSVTELLWKFACGKK